MSQIKYHYNKNRKSLCYFSVTSLTEIFSGGLYEVCTSITKLLPIHVQSDISVDYTEENLQ